ncbi:MAG: hypothetical protein R2712_17705 [Vicinamibacterales bacterium]
MQSGELHRGAGRRDERPAAEFVTPLRPEVHGAALFPLVHRWTRGVDFE